MSNTNLNFYLQREMDDSLSLLVLSGDLERPLFGPSGSYYSLLSNFMDFTPRVNRFPIRCATEEQVMECVDAVTRLIGHKLLIYSTADAWFNDQWGICLGTSAEMTVITFLYAGNITELEVNLRLEGYIVNDIGAHP